MILAIPRTHEVASTPASEDATSAVPAFARRIPFGVMLVLTGITGWVAAGILILEKLELYRDSDHIISCDINPWVSCGQVMRTWQSELLGFPNPFLGLVGLTIIITTGTALLTGARFERRYWVGLQAGVMLGSVFAIWPWSQALFEITILCLYCIVVWAAMIPLFVLPTVRNPAHGVLPAPAAFTRRISAWVVPIIALTHIAVAASVFFRFLHVFV